ncbi:DMT family transporter [Zwartia sp.]|uniref:DMT family transporter n=1 Tax=Zwartia sp. TaxID=2978004 RepID=UPI003BAF7F39
MISARLLIWAGLAGALIPAMVILNARLGRTIGEPLHAPVILFGVGFIFCLACALLLTQSIPNLGALKDVKLIDYLGGLIVGFYVINATLLAPRIGVANFIICAVSSQILVSVVIDHYGLFGAAIRPVSMKKLFGVGLLVLGLVITQLADKQPNAS